MASKSLIDLNKLKISIRSQTKPADLFSQFLDAIGNVIGAKLAGDALGWDNPFNLYVALLPSCQEAEITLQLIYDGEKLTNESSAQIFTWVHINSITKELMDAVFARSSEEVLKILTSDKKNEIQSNALSPYG